MLKQVSRNIGLLMAVLGGSLAFGLRRWFLQGSTVGEIGLWIVTAVSILAVLGICWKLEPRTDYVDGFSSERNWMILSLLGAIALILGNGLEILEGTTGIDRILNLWGLVAGATMAVIAIGRAQGKVASVWIHSIATLYLVVALIFEFRDWSIDPTLLDYCFSLFAAICAMLANVHIGHFVFNKGRRKTTVFWCLMATIMGMCAMADGGLSTMMMLGGMAIWTLANGGQLLEN